MRPELILKSISDSVSPIIFKAEVYGHHYEFQREELRRISQAIKATEDNKVLVRRKLELNKQIEKFKVNEHQQIEVIARAATSQAEIMGFKISVIEEAPHLFNGFLWVKLEVIQVENFLRDTAVRAGINKVTANTTKWRSALYKQLKSVNTVLKGKPSSDINLANGVLTNDGSLRVPTPDDWFFYQLPYDYDPSAMAPLFLKSLKRILPDKKDRQILAEYLGYVLTKNMKLEKILFMYGTGSNGKGFLTEVIKAVFGDENLSYFSLAELTDSKGYHRALLGGKLLNVCSEYDGKIQPGAFKQLASGEEISARHPSERAFTLKDYGRLMFAANRLPTATEVSHGFFRRFLFLHFKVRINPEEADIYLHKQVIAKELPGVLNWILKGRQRLVSQKGFTRSKNSDSLLQHYRQESNNVAKFIREFDIIPSNSRLVQAGLVYGWYRRYCGDNGLKFLSSPKFKQRMEEAGLLHKRTSKCSNYLLDHSVPKDYLTHTYLN